MWLWVLMCSFRFPDVEKLFPHSSHLNVCFTCMSPDVLFQDHRLQEPLSTFFTFKWFFTSVSNHVFLKCPDIENLFRNLSHSNSFSPIHVRVILYCFRFPDEENLFPHSSDLNGFSPVWVLMCSFSSPDVKNLLPHSSHLNGLSTVWLLRCCLRSLDTENLFPQSSQSKDFLPVRVMLACCSMYPDGEPLSSHSNFTV